MSAGSIDFVYDLSTGIRTAIYRGVVDDRCLFQAYLDLIARDDFIPLAHDLVDLRQIEHLELSEDGLRSLGHLLSDQALVPPPVVVPGLSMVADTSLVFGLARMYEMVNDPYLPKQTMVFRRIDKVIKWLKSLPRLA